MTNAPLVSAIVVSYRTPQLTVEAIQSLKDFMPAGSEIWVIDNASGDESVQMIGTRHPDVNLIELRENVGFGRANNIGLGRSEGQYLLLLNSDARLTDARTLQVLLERMDADPAVGVVGPRLEDEAGTLEFSARAFPTLAREITRRFGLYLVLPRERVRRWLLGEFHAPAEPTEVDWITGACMLVRRDAYERVGGFDPRIFLYGEEQEWCRRFQSAGWKVVYDPTVTVVHKRGASGLPGPWRVRAALAGDVRIFRWSHGMLQALAFNLIRTVGFGLETTVLRVVSARGRSEYLHARAAKTGREFLQQLFVLVRRPFG